MKYDYLIVGAGLLAQLLPSGQSHSKYVLVLDKRPHIAGNVYTEKLRNQCAQIRCAYFSYQ